MNKAYKPLENQNIVRIGLNGSMLDCRPTGVGIYTYNLINYIHNLTRQSKKYHLSVFTPTTMNIDRDINIVRLPKILQSSDHGKLAALCRMAWNILTYPIVASKLDIYVNPTTHGSLFLKNQVLTIHDLISLRQNNISSHQRLYFRFILPRLVKKAAKVIAISEATRKDIVELLGCDAGKVSVIYNGYDKNEFYYNGLIEGRILERYGLSNYILAMGPTYAHKNFETLLEAYGHLPVELKSKHPLVIGGGFKPYLDKLKKISERPGLKDFVHFLGYVPQDHMRALYNEALCLVFPSLHEGFGFPILEAMACGCPVISSSTSSMPEVGGDSIIYFNPEKFRELEKQLINLITDVDLQHQLKEAGLRRAKNFSWEKTAKEYLKIIDTLTNK
jgi:glycosyltransferase involved in cell wall biosynthesis